MSALHKHIERQQSKMVTLCGVILAIDLLKNEGLGEGDAQVSLLLVARELADQICNNLDSANLPEVPDCRPVPKEVNA